ncbi:MAG: glycosyltransferase [Pseudomonadota bacterium]
MSDTLSVAAVVIGRNEGPRLAACLASIGADCAPVIYVDSGSTDNSLRIARDAGAKIVELDLDRPFTAARARNAGLEQLGADTALVQFVDGDCTLEPGWIGTATAFMAEHREIAALAGRLTERFPEASIYNRLCDIEWQADAGEGAETGGIVMMRRAALDAVGPFDPQLIAGEEPDLCLRLRRAGWKIWRLDTPMARHDAAMTQFSQFWTRSVRSGWAALEGAMRYADGPERFNRSRVLSAVIWGLIAPGLAGAGLIGGAVAALAGWGMAAALGLGMVASALMLTVVQAARLARMRLRRGDDATLARAYAVLTLASKPAQIIGMARYLRMRGTGRAGRLIEYREQG